MKIDWQFEAYQDILTGGMASSDEFSSEEEYETYLRFRNTPINEIDGLNNELEEIYM